MVGAARYQRGRPYHHLRTVRRALGSWRPRTALDVACGTGLSTRALAELGIAVLGLDPAAGMVAVARAATALPYAVGAAEALPVRTGAVELVTVSSGVHWFGPPFFAEAARVLRPGGALLLYDHAGAHLPGDPSFTDWVRGPYAARFPAPARGAMAGATDPGPHFATAATDRWLDPVLFTRDQLADYLLTQSGTLASPEPPDAVRRWLLDQLTPFFGTATRTVAFHATTQLLRPR